MGEDKTPSAPWAQGQEEEGEGERFPIALTNPQGCGHAAGGTGTFR